MFHHTPFPRFNILGTGLRVTSHLFECTAKTEGMLLKTMSVFVLEDGLEGVHSFPEYRAYQVRGTYDGKKPSTDRLDIASCRKNMCACNTGKTQSHPKAPMIGFLQSF